MIRDASEVLDRLLEGGHSTIAGRLAGAFRNIGRDRIADHIAKTMRAARYDVRESDPFKAKALSHAFEFRVIRQNSRIPLLTILKYQFITLPKIDDIQIRV